MGGRGDGCRRIPYVLLPHPQAGRQAKVLVWGQLTAAHSAACRRQKVTVDPRRVGRESTRRPCVVSRACAVSTKRVLRRLLFLPLRLTLSLSVVCVMCVRSVCVRAGALTRVRGCCYGRRE